MRRRGGLQQDYILRLIREAAEALALLRARLMGGTGTPDMLRADAARATSMLLGADGPLLAQLDAATAAWLAGNPERVALWAALLDVEADAAAAGGDPAHAQARHERADALRSAAQTLWPPEDSPSC